MHFLPGGVMLFRPNLFELGFNFDPGAHLMCKYERSMEQYLLKRRRWLWRKAIYSTWVVAALVCQSRRHLVGLKKLGCGKHEDCPTYCQQCLEIDDSRDEVKKKLKERETAAQELQEALRKSRDWTMSDNLQSYANALQHQYDRRLVHLACHEMSSKLFEPKFEEKQKLLIRGEQRSKWKNNVYGVTVYKVEDGDCVTVEYSDGGKKRFLKEKLEELVVKLQSVKNCKELKFVELQPLLIQRSCSPCCQGESRVYAATVLKIKAGEKDKCEITVQYSGDADKDETFIGKKTLHENTDGHPTVSFQSEELAKRLVQHANIPPHLIDSNRFNDNDLLLNLMEQAACSASIGCKEREKHDSMSGNDFNESAPEKSRILDGHPRLKSAQQHLEKFKRAIQAHKQAQWKDEKVKLNNICNPSRCRREYKGERTCEHTCGRMSRAMHTEKSQKAVPESTDEEKAKTQWCFCWGVKPMQTVYEDGCECPKASDERKKWVMLGCHHRYASKEDVIDLQSPASRQQRLARARITTKFANLEQLEQLEQLEDQTNQALDAGANAEGYGL